MSTRNDMLLLAWEKGYRTTSLGQVVSPQGTTISLRLESGYPAFTMHHHLKGKRAKGSIRVHRLVAYQKYGKRLFSPGVEVRHLDGDRSNNRVDNIVLGTRSQNTLDISVTNRILKAKYAASFQRALTEDQVAEIRKKYADGVWKYKDIMKEFGIAKSTVSYIINRVTYS